jgi:hypothetical protein
VAGLAAACATGSGVVYATGPGATTGDGLRRVRWSQQGAEFVKPGTAFASYRRVLIDPVTISTPPAAERPRMGRTPVFVPTPAYLEGMRRVYQESFAKEFGRAGIGVVAEPGPGVLRISGHVTDLVLTARLDPEADPDVNELISSFGELTLLLDVRDAATNVPLLRSVDRQSIAHDSVQGVSRNSTGANLGAQRLVFAHQALLLRQRIEELQRTGSPPAPAE